MKPVKTLLLTGSVVIGVEVILSTLWITAGGSVIKVGSWVYRDYHYVVSVVAVWIALKVGRRI